MANMPLTDIGITPRKASQFSSKGIETVTDLLGYYPTKYLDFRNPISFAEGKYHQGEHVAIKGKVVSGRVIDGKHYMLRLTDGNTFCTVFWFNQPFRTRQFSVGDVIALGGVVSWNEQYNNMTMATPDFVSTDIASAFSIQPVYRKIKGMSVEYLEDAIKLAMPYTRECSTETLSLAQMRALRVPPIAEAIHMAHQPTDEKEIRLSRKRRAVDVLYPFCYELEAKKAEAAKVSFCRIRDSLGGNIQLFGTKKSQTQPEPVETIAAQEHKQSIGNQVMEALGVGENGTGLDEESEILMPKQNQRQLEAEGVVKESVLFLIISDDNASMQLLSSLLLSFLFKDLKEAFDAVGGEGRIPVNVVADELANTGVWPNFEKTIATARSRKIAVSLILQSLPQLTQLYGEENAETIIGCCNTMLVLGCNDKYTAEYISDKSGIVTIRAKSVSDTRASSAGNRGVMQGYSLSEGDGKRNLVNPDEVQHLDKEQILIMTNGQNMLEAKRFGFIHHPLFNDPHFVPTKWAELPKTADLYPNARKHDAIESRESSFGDIQRQKEINTDITQKRSEERMKPRLSKKDLLATDEPAPKKKNAFKK